MAAELTFLFLPGLDGTGILAQPFMARFAYAAQTKLIVYPKNEYRSLSDLAAQVEREVEDGQKLVVIAESFGGLVLLELLRRRKLTPAGIVLLATFGEPPKPALLALARWLPIDYLPWHRAPRFLLKRFAVGLDATDEQLRLVEQTSRSISARALAYRLRIIADNPFNSLRERWPIPCCYIQATADKAVPAHCVDWFRQRFSNLTLKRIDGGHFLLHTRTAQCAGIIEEFVQQLR